MMPIPFPFSHRSVFRFVNESTRMALIEAEEAVTPGEIQQALNGRSAVHFRQPLVLFFPDPKAVFSVPFRFSFDVEVLVVGLSGCIEKAYSIPKYRQGDAPQVQFFSGFDSVILVPSGFINNWNVIAGITSVRRMSLSYAGKRTA